MSIHEQVEMARTAHAGLWEGAGRAPLTVACDGVARLTYRSGEIVERPVADLPRRPLRGAFGTQPLQCFTDFPRLVDLRVLLSAGIVPWREGVCWMTGLRQPAVRLGHILAHGGSVPPGATDHKPSRAEVEFGSALGDVTGNHVPWWREVVVSQRKGTGLPWRIDFLILATAWDRLADWDDANAAPRDHDGLTSFASIVDQIQRRQESGVLPLDGYRLLAVEIDGPHHETPRQQAADAFKERDLRKLGVEVYRVSAAWASVDPWATVAEVLHVAGFDVLRRDHPATLDEYVCRLCSEKLTRWDRHWIDGGAGLFAHSECTFDDPDGWHDLFADDCQ